MRMRVAQISEPGICIHKHSQTCATAGSGGRGRGKSPLSKFAAPNPKESTLEALRNTDEPFPFPCLFTSWMLAVDLPGGGEKSGECALVVVDRTLAWLLFPPPPRVARTRVVLEVKARCAAAPGLPRVVSGFSSNRSSSIDFHRSSSIIST